MCPFRFKVFNYQAPRWTIRWFLPYVLISEYSDKLKLSPKRKQTKGISLSHGKESLFLSQVRVWLEKDRILPIHKILYDHCKLCKEFWKKLKKKQTTTLHYITHQFTQSNSVSTTMHQFSALTQVHTKHYFSQVWILVQKPYP